MKNIISIILVFQSLFCFSQDKYDYSDKRKIDSLVEVERGFFNDREYDASIVICQRLIELGFDESIYKGYSKMILSKYLKYFPNKDLIILNEVIENTIVFIDFMKNSVKYKDDYVSIVETHGMLFQLKYELAEINDNLEIYRETLLIFDEVEKMANLIDKKWERDKQIAMIKFNKAKTFLKIHELSNDYTTLIKGLPYCQDSNDYYSNLTTDQIMYFNSKEILARYHIELSSNENFDYHKKSAENIILNLEEIYKDSYYSDRIKIIDSLKIKTKELIKQ